MNNVRLIDAVAYCGELEKEKTFCERSEDFIDAMECAIADLSDMPTIEAEPIIHAKWEFVEETALWITDLKEFGGNGEPSTKKMPVCSNCKKEYGLMALEFKRCPECGAHMDLEE